MIQGFLAVRKHADRILLLVEMMQGRQQQPGLISRYSSASCVCVRRARSAAGRTFALGMPCCTVPDVCSCPCLSHLPRARPCAASGVPCFKGRVAAVQGLKKRFHLALPEPQVRPLMLRPVCLPGCLPACPPRACMYLDLSSGAAG
jgi:hypothetical protein